MLIAIDIGNTTISFGLIEGQKIKRFRQIETTVSTAFLKKEVQRALNPLKKRKIDDVIICSVVPKALRVLQPAVEKTLGIKAKVIGRNFKVPIKNLYRKPKQVGQDRLVCAYAAMQCYGVPAIIVDSGTAITFDVVSKNKEYLGGVIVPGIRLSAESLFKKAALLPKTQIKLPRNLIGKDTEESILSGLFFGYGALTTGVISMIAKKIKGKPKVIMTGGYTKLLRRFFTKKVNIIDPDLVFKGMNLLYKQQKRAI